MSKPKTTLAYVHSVFVRTMEFEKAGDSTLGHHHTYDHITLVAYGQVSIEVVEDNTTKILTAPTCYLTKAHKSHKITALTDGAVACCIHALRNDDGTVIDPQEDLNLQRPQYDPTDMKDVEAAFKAGHMPLWVPRFKFVETNAKQIDDEPS